MIILTPEQATRIRGISPSDGHAALEPVPIKGSTEWFVHEDVARDPAHSDIRDFLLTCPRREVLPTELYDPYHATLNPTGSTADARALQQRAISYSSAGVRPPA